MATMAGKRDYYEVLEIEQSASDKQISDAYRRMAMKFHPDRNPGDDEAVKKFKEAAEAFEVLSDQNKRARYDRYGHAGVDGPSGSPHFTDVNDIFAAFGDLFGEGGFGDIFGGDGRRRSRKGGDVACQLDLTLLEAARGATKTVEFHRHEPCAKCHGSGAKPGTKPETCNYCRGQGQVIQASGIFRVQTTCPSCRGSGKSIKEPCSDCRGAGQVRRKVRREVYVPAGVDEGNRLRLEGEGEPSAQGGPPGDCYCVIKVAEHSLFQREGPHLLCQVPITYAQAALGATIEVPTLDGREELEVPAGTQPGAVFKLRGKGMAHHRYRGVGDLIVQVQMEVPKNLTERQEELLRELAELERVHVSAHRKGFFDKVRDYFSAHDRAAQAEE